MGRPLSTSLRYSVSSVNGEYSECPVTKNSRPPRATTRCTPASSDSESNQENIENDSVSNTETDVENSESVSEMTGDYMPELEYIDYLLKEQLNTMQAVTVSGNSISVSLDNGSLLALTEVKENQISIQEEIKTISVLVSCVIFALCAEFLFNSAKRVVKNMTNRKE